MFQIAGIMTMGLVGFIQAWLFFKKKEFRDLIIYGGFFMLVMGYIVLAALGVDIVNTTKPILTILKPFLKLHFEYH